MHEQKFVRIIVGMCDSYELPSAEAEAWLACHLRDNVSDDSVEAYVKGGLMFLEAFWLGEGLDYDLERVRSYYEERGEENSDRAKLVADEIKKIYAEADLVNRDEFARLLAQEIIESE